MDVNGWCKKHVFYRGLAILPTGMVLDDGLLDTWCGNSLDGSLHFGGLVWMRTLSGCVVVEE